MGNPNVAAVAGEVNLASTTTSSSSLTSDSKVLFASGSQEQITTPSEPDATNEDDALEFEGVWMTSVTDDTIIE